MSITREEVNALVKEAYKDQGYGRPVDMLEAVRMITEPAVASNTKARAKTAIHKDALMSETWPLVQPLTEIEADDPEREAKTVLYKELRKRTWETTKPLDGRLQKLVATRDGLVVCRLGGLLGDSVYLTNDPDCFRIDVIESRSGKDIDSVTKLSTFYGSVSMRIPEMAPMIAEAFEASLQGVLAAGRAHIPLLQQGGSKGAGE
jgi:hypothetical protein